MDNTIIRDPTPVEAKDFIPLQTQDGKILTPQDKFAARIAEERLKSQLKGLPFAAVAARADVQDVIDKFQKKVQRQGTIEKEFKFPDIDWNKYSTLSNFEKIDEGQKADKYLSKIHRLPVFVKFTKYKYKGFVNTYTVMEPEDIAVERAIQKLEARRVIITKKGTS